MIAAAKGVIYALLVIFGAIIAVPDPTGVLPVAVAIVCLPVVGYAFVDGSLQDLRWGIAALYATGFVASVLVSIAREPLLDAGLYGHALTATAILPVCVLIGAYLTVRRRGAPSNVPILS